MSPQAPIAVLGIGCRFPGADDAESFWQLLRDGVDAISEIGEERWPMRRFLDAGLTDCRWAGLVEDGDCYDRLLFNLSEHESERMDPQQGMALELAWQALEHAGIDPGGLAEREVGVYLGIGTRDYDRRAANLWPGLDYRTSTGASGAVIANRVSYCLGLTGPSVAVDNACAASLSAVHLACQALRLGECGLALAGGVQLVLSPANLLAFSQAKLLARDGRCKSFSERADGYVCGEGGGVLVLKPLAQALADGDPIRAVIRGSALQHNGQSNGLSAPLGRAQQTLIRRALDAAGVAPAEIGYVEAHASGTTLGDAIEVGALKAVFAPDRDGLPPCLIGSVKTNIGHLEAAAGIAGLIKALLAVGHGEVPASLHAEPPARHLKLDRGPLAVAATTRPWPDLPGPRRAGVSALGFGGGNAHMVVEAAPAPAEPHRDLPPTALLLPLAAATPLTLRRLAERWLKRLAACRDDRAAFADCCAGAAVGRAALKHRLAVVARDADAARFALAAFLDGRDAEGLHRDGAARPARLRLPSTRALLELVAASEPFWRDPLLASIETAITHANGSQEASEAAWLGLAALLEDWGLTAVAVAGGDAAQAGFADRLGRRLAALAPERRRPTPALCCDVTALAGAGPALLFAPPVAASGEWWLELEAPAEDAAELSRQLADLLAAAWAGGCRLDWAAFYRSWPRRHQPLPTYPFERARHYRIPGEESWPGAPSDHSHPIPPEISP